MRFIANISKGPATIARVSIDDRSSETLGQNALRARRELIRDADRHRSPALSDDVLDKMAEIYGHVVASQIISRKAREVTCVSRNGVVTQHEGQIAVLTMRGDLIMSVSVMDDAKVAETERFVEEVLAEA